MILNVGQYYAIPSIVIPSLRGLSAALNPDETVHIGAAESSWLREYKCKCLNAFRCLNIVSILAGLANVGHPIGGLISGPLCDQFGRRKLLMAICIPLVSLWIMLGYAQSFPIICIGFVLMGICTGVKESPSLTYVCEIR